MRFVPVRGTKLKRYFPRPAGEIGRHARLRIWCREAWGFKSLAGHHPFLRGDGEAKKLIGPEKTKVSLEFGFGIRDVEPTTQEMISLHTQKYSTLKSINL